MNESKHTTERVQVIRVERLARQDSGDARLQLSEHVGEIHVTRLHAHPQFIKQIEQAHQDFFELAFLV